MASMFNDAELVGKSSVHIVLNKISGKLIGKTLLSLYTYR